MCAIIDACILGLVVPPRTDPRFAPVVDWLTNPKKTGCVVVGGHLAAELQRSPSWTRYFAALQRAGRAWVAPSGAVARVEADFRREGQHCSNDPHVLALAIVSGARTLCSDDQPLGRDFRCAQLISRPRGFIYKTAKHRHLLRHTASCARG